MSWFYLCLLSISALALAELTQQHLLFFKKSFDERTSAVLTFLVQAIFSIPVVLFTDLRYSIFDVFNIQIFPLIIAVDLIAAIAMVYYLKSFKVKNISLSGMFVSFSVVVSTTLGILFYSEGFYFQKIFGILLVLAAIVSLNVKNVLLEKNHLYGLLAGTMFGITYTLDKSIVLKIHPMIYIFWSFILVSIFGFLFGPKTIIKAIKNSKASEYKPIIISGVGYFLYNIFTFFAYKFGGEVGRVDAINNSQVFLVILFEYFLLKHKTGFWRKIGTAFLAFTGVLILGYL